MPNFLADGFIKPGDFAVTTRPIGNLGSRYHIPAHAVVRVTAMSEGEPAKRTAHIAYVHDDERTIGEANVPEHTLRACEVVPELD